MRFNTAIALAAAAGYAAAGPVPTPAGGEIQAQECGITGCEETNTEGTQETAPVIPAEEAQAPSPEISTEESTPETRQIAVPENYAGLIASLGTVPASVYPELYAHLYNSKRDLPQITPEQYHAITSIYGKRDLPQITPEQYHAITSIYGKRDLPQLTPEQYNAVTAPIGNVPAWVLNPELEPAKRDLQDRQISPEQYNAVTAPIGYVPGWVLNPELEPAKRDLQDRQISWEQYNAILGAIGTKPVPVPAKRDLQARKTIADMSEDELRQWILQGQMFSTPVPLKRDLQDRQISWEQYNAILGAIGTKPVPVPAERDLQDRQLPTFTPEQWAIITDGIAPNGLPVKRSTGYWRA